MLVSSLQFTRYTSKTITKAPTAPRIDTKRMFSIHTEAIISRSATIKKSKSLSVNPADNPSDKDILLIFLPATAFNTSPAVRIGEKFPAKSPIVFTI